MERNQITVVQVIPASVGGGAEVLVKELHKRLPSHGINSRAIYFSHKSNTPLDEKQYNLGFSNPRSPFVVRRLRRQLKEIIKRSSGAVIVHCHLTWPLFYVPIAISGLPATLVYTEHSTNNRRRIFRLMFLFERRWYKHYAVVISISEGVQANLKAWLGRMVDINPLFIVVPNGARTFARKDANPVRKEGAGIHLVGVGSLRRHKGFDIALEAIALCRAEVSSFTIVGDGPQRANLQRQVQALGLGEIVRFAGWSDDVESYYQSADAALISSRWEGFSLVAVEALSVGLPLICPDVQGLKNVVEHCESVFVCAPESAASMARAIEEIAANIEQGVDFSSISVEHARQFDMSKMVSRYADVYRRLPISD